MKRANGTGTIVYWGKNRRRPFSARIVKDWNADTGNAIYQYLTNSKGEKYFKERLEAEEILLNYNKTKDNLDIDKSNYTFKDVYEEYSLKHFPTKEEMELERTTHQKTKGKLGASVTSNLKGAYKRCESLYDKLYKSLKKSDFEEIIINTKGCGTVINSLANLFRKLDNYALENDIIVKGYADLIKVTEDLFVPTQNEGTPYTYKEIEEIWKYQGNIIADITLATIYTGCRIEELLFAKIKDFYIKDGFFIGGLKTTAGKGRIIPIHDDILELFKKYYNKNKDNEFIFTVDNQKIDYSSYFQKQYRQFMNKLKMNHNTHDGRKTLHSELDRLNANKVCVNKIFGHKCGNIGDDAYTKKTLEELKYTINLVNYKAKKGEKITYFSISNHNKN